jgi:hypothetical protein
MNKNSLLLTATAVLFASTTPLCAQTSNGTLTWYLYVSGGDDLRGDLVVTTSNVLSASVVEGGPPPVLGYQIESISGTVQFGSPALPETVTALLPPGSNVVEGCAGFANQEGELTWNCTTATNMTVDDLIVPNLKGRGAGLDGAGIGFASVYVNNNAQPGQLALIDDDIQLYSQSGQSYMLDLGPVAGTTPVSITVSTPEPDTLALTCLGLSGIWLTRRRRRKARGWACSDSCRAGGFAPCLAFPTPAALAPSQPLEQPRGGARILPRPLTMESRTCLTHVPRCATSF